MLASPPARLLALNTPRCATLPPLQDAREDLQGTEVAVAQLQAQVDALMSAGEMAGDAAQQLDAAVAALEVRSAGVLVVPSSGALFAGGSLSHPSHRHAACLHPSSPNQLNRPHQPRSPIHTRQDKRAYLVEAQAQQQGAFLQVLRRFVGVLSSGQGTAAGDTMDTGGWGGQGMGRAGGAGRRAQMRPRWRPAGRWAPPSPPPCPLHLLTHPLADADEATALQDYMLAALRSFVRRYNVQCAQLAERIGGEVLGGEGVTQELRAAVEAQLNL